MSTMIYQVNVTVASHVIAPDNGFVIVYAQRVTGAKIPLAALKLSLGKLPVNIAISEGNAMIQGVKLSDVKEFVIKVRWSKSGNVTDKKGDWQGASQVIKSGQASPINIIVKELL